MSNIVSYPLDTVKVRIQLSKKVDNVKVIPVMKEIYQKEGVSIN